MSKQAVAENAEEVASQTSEENGAQDDDLDTLLAEYDNGVKGESKPAEKVETDDDPVRIWAERKMAEDQQAEAESIKSEAVKSVKEGFDYDLSDKLVWGFISQAANSDQRIVKAFESRKENPAAWKKAVQTLQKELKEELSLDASATADRQSVEAAIRGASKDTSSQEGPDLGKMSPGDFEAYKRGLLRGK